MFFTGELNFIIRKEFVICFVNRDDFWAVNYIFLNHY